MSRPSKTSKTKVLFVAEDIGNVIVSSTLAIMGGVPTWVRVLAGASALMTFVGLLADLSSSTGEDEDPFDEDITGPLDDRRVKRWDGR
jgi:hypothetical protein